MAYNPDDHEMTVIERGMTRIDIWATDNDELLSKWWAELIITSLIPLVNSWAQTFVFARWLFSGLEFLDDREDD